MAAEVRNTDCGALTNSSQTAVECTVVYRVLPSYGIKLTSCEYCWQLSSDLKPPAHVKQNLQMIIVPIQGVPKVTTPSYLPSEKIK